MPNFIITIDGPSASGKSTLAKQIASKLEIGYLDSGAVYRTVAAYLIEKNLEPKTELEWKDFFQLGEIKLVYKGHFVHYYFNDLELTPLLRTDSVAMRASTIAKERLVREFVNDTLRKTASTGNFIADGRDLGTKVFPNAKMKFFITASVESRAKRRELELISLGVATTYEKVYSQLLERDEQDSKRKNDPLKQALDAYFIDTTKLSTDQVCDEMLLEIRKKLSPKGSWLQRAVCPFLRGLFRKFYHLHIQGEVYSEQLFGGVIYANHSSYYDSLLLVAILGPKAVFVADEKVVKRNILFRFLCSLFPLILVDEKNIPHDFFAQCKRYMKQGYSVVIFPEGKRATDGSITHFQEGLSAIVQVCKVKQVLPIYMGGVYSVWPKKRLFPKFSGKVVVLISKAIRVQGLDESSSKESRVRLTRHLEERLKELENYYKDTYEQRS
ncbi:MAG: (d)CMP kinase [Chlamydiia bacterium]